MNSTHKAEIVPVELKPHTNADSLSVIPVFGYNYVGRTQDWVGVKRAAYIPPDTLVDVKRPEFSFLADQAKGSGKARIKAKRLRGIVSYGLLVPVADDTPVGDDWFEKLGLEHYEPPEPSESQRDKFVIGGEEESGPNLETGGMYDIDAFERYHQVFEKDEPVILMEKVDGSNCRAVFWDGRYWVKSRKRWVKRVPDYAHVNAESLVSKGVPSDKAQAIVEGIKSKPVRVNGFWEVLERTTGAMKMLKDNPGMVVYCEIAGSTNRLKYGFPDGNQMFAFDVFADGRFLNYHEGLAHLNRYGVPTAPALWSGSYSFDMVKTHSEGMTTCNDAKPGTIREGVVVRPLVERWDRLIGRVQLKCVNPSFLAI